MSQWIVGVISFQKIFGLYGLKHHIVEISGDVTDAQGLTGRVFQLRVGSGSGIGKNYRVGSGLGSGSGIGIIY